MSFTEDLITGLAQRIADAGIGTYRSDGSAYQASETAIVFGAMPPDPDRAIVLSDYPVADDPSLSDSVLGMQMRCRGGADPNDVKQLSDELFDLFHGAQQYTVNGIRIVESLRNSGLPGGRDDNNRWETFQNYYFTVHRPSSNRT